MKKFLLITLLVFSLTVLVVELVSVIACSEPASTIEKMPESSPRVQIVWTNCDWCATPTMLIVKIDRRDEYLIVKTSDGIAVTPLLKQNTDSNFQKWNPNKALEGK